MKGLQLGLKLLNKANILAGTQSSLSWIISLAHAKSLFKIVFWQKNFFICYPISKIFAAHFMTNLLLDIGILPY